MGRLDRGDTAYDGWMHSSFYIEPRERRIVRQLDKAAITVSEVECRFPNPRRTSPVPVENSLLLTIHIDPCPRYDMWLGGRFLQTPGLKTGSSVLYDLRTQPSVSVGEAFHNVSFQMPMVTLDQIADREGMPRTQEFQSDFMNGFDDRVLSSLALTLLPFLRGSRHVDRLFTDHVTIAAAAHALKKYGGAAPRPQALPPAPLSPWQKAMACEMLRAHLDGEITLEDIASICGMPSLVFAQSFQKSTGMAPWRWLEGCRVATARDVLLLRPHIPLDQAATICGFSNTRGFVAAFVKRIGIHPQKWRVQH
ncbi:MAG: helix-turn-helix transcriptional regulator [Rhizobiaceae bacterium]|nr:helix-turn-helix transcriptional regulator [Rhizobiaceae bacterium]